MERGRWRAYAPGEVIYYQGGTGSDVVVLQAGYAKVVTQVGDRQALVAIRCPGNVLGENETLQRGGTTIRPHTAQALAERTIGLHIDAGVFRSFLDAHLPGWGALSRELSNQRSEAEIRIAGLAIDAANRRLARALCTLLDHEAIRRDGAGPIMIELSQGDLASWIGTSRETVERTLQSWRRRGIVSTGYRSITVRRSAELYRIAGDSAGVGFASSGLAG